MQLVLFCLPVHVYKGRGIACSRQIARSAWANQRLSCRVKCADRCPPQPQPTTSTFPWPLHDKLIAVVPDTKSRSHCVFQDIDGLDFLEALLHGSPSISREISRIEIYGEELFSWAKENKYLNRNENEVHPRPTRLWTTT